jgi:hypothetical protein
LKTLTSLLLILLLASASLCQTATPSPASAPPPPAQAAEPHGQARDTEPEPLPQHITPEQARELFQSVDEILNFVSRDTGLPIKSRVKRKLASRDEVERFVEQRMKDDEDAKRLERSEVVLKKFGLVPRDFDLRSFLLALLKEQVAGFYDAKTKTVYLLDWVEPEQQKPVLAHELTHALQDQNFGMEAMAKKAREHDATGIEADERLAALQAVTEGQAMLVLLDYSLVPAGESVEGQPQLVDAMEAGLTAPSGPNMVMFNRAPLFLQQVLLFPYRFGTLFERDVLVASGKQKAFTGALKDPPKDTRQIMQPGTYLSAQSIAPLKPVAFEKLATGYKQWDLSAMGEFDVVLLMDQFADQQVAKEISPHWRGGYYWAALTPEAARNKSDLPQTSDIALAYVSQWSTPEAASRFAALYAQSIPKRYAGAHKVRLETNSGAGTVSGTSDGANPRDEAASREGQPEPKTGQLEAKKGNVFIPAFGPAPLQTWLSGARYGRLQRRERGENSRCRVPLASIAPVICNLNTVPVFS